MKKQDTNSITVRQDKPCEGYENISHEKALNLLQEYNSGEIAASKTEKKGEYTIYTNSEWVLEGPIQVTKNNGLSVTQYWFKHLVYEAKVKE